MFENQRVEEHASDESSRERRLLALSIVCSVVLASMGIAVGVSTGAQIILFDGFYTFLGIGLSWMAIRISRVVSQGPTQRYPFGREALTPLIIGVEGVALLATCAYATFNAVLTIVQGGSQTPSGWGVVYAMVAFVIPLSVATALRRRGSDSELVRAEATQWLSGGFLGLGMLAAFFVAQLIEGTSWARGARYVDPVLVVVACALFVTPPLRMIRLTFIELVEGTPSVDVTSPIRTRVTEVCREFGLDEEHLRMTKVGRKIYVEIDFVVDASWTVRQTDDVRRALNDQLSTLSQDLWLTVEFSADARTLE